MKRKSLWKLLEAGVLTLSLVLAPIAALSVQAAPAEEKTGSVDTGNAPGDEVSIPVWGFSGQLDGTEIYSVDVEWGAMTFQYGTGAGGVWDPATHTYSGTSKGWYVYDSKNKSVADSEQSSINQISVTNHSNAAVKATFAYQGTGQYSAITGNFTVGEDTTADTSAGAGTTAIKLDSADNGKGDAGAGEAVTGKVYFMPSGVLTTTGPTDDTQWAELGKITVGIDAAK